MSFLQLDKRRKASQIVLLMAGTVQTRGEDLSAQSSEKTQSERPKRRVTRTIFKTQKCLQSEESDCREGGRCGHYVPMAFTLMFWGTKQRQRQFRVPVHPQYIHLETKVSCQYNGERVQENLVITYLPLEKKGGRDHFNKTTCHSVLDISTYSPKQRIKSIS